jgi:hypothetical protein
MSARFFYRLSAALGLLSPLPAFAQRTLIVGTGTSFTFWEIMQRIISYLAGAISTIALVMFVVGAFLITISGAKEEYRKMGKDLMIGAVLSLAVVLGAYAILRTVDYFLSA